MKKKEIVDDVTMKRAITRITYEIIERNKNLDKIVLAGIKTRGVYIAQRIQERLKQLENLDVPLIELDTKAYRDDVKSEQDTSLIPIEIDGTDVILVDDVLYTGRTIRAAIDNIVSHGRPARVGLAVLVDRGHRELPIRADYVGKNIPTSESEEIEVLVTEVDGKDSVFRFPDKILSSKHEFIAYFMSQLGLTDQDIVILDRATGTGQAVFRNAKPAKLGVVVHAEHFSENAVTDKTILWNNFYEYQFSNADKVDFFITATERQRSIMLDQFNKYTPFTPHIVTIPVGSVDKLRKPEGERKPFSIITASRLANEKHVDWLAKAVVKAKESLPQVNFDIYGTGAEEAKLKTIIEENQAQDYIHLKGHQDLTEVYKDYELYLSGSKSEGFGLTLLEAVGSGLGMIGFDVRYGNQTFIKDNENGYLIPRFEKDDEPAIVAALAEKIVAFFNRSDLEHVHQVSYDIAKGFLTEEIEQKWLNLVKEMTSHD